MESIQINKVKIPASNANAYLVEKVSSGLNCLRVDTASGNIEIGNATDNFETHFLGTGYVGIGTVAPNAVLEVSKSDSGEAVAEFLTNSAGTNDSSVSIGFATGFSGDVSFAKQKIGGYRETTYGKGSLIFAVDSNADASSADLIADEKMRINAEGRVGIGTNAPNSELDVKGEISITNSSDLVAARLGTDGAGEGILILEDASSANKVVIDANGDSYFNGGNVGIGIAAPLERIQVHNAGTGSSDHAYTFYTTGDTGSTASDGLLVGYSAGEKAYMWNREATDLGIATGNAEVITVLSGGNVGIGTTAPNSELTIAKSASSCNTDIDTYSTTATQQSALNLRKSASASIGTASETADGEDLGQINFYGCTSAPGFAVSSFILAEQDGAADADAVPGRLSFYTSDLVGNNLAMSITSDSDVGINETNPDSKLEVNGTFHVTETTNIGGTTAASFDDSYIRYAVLGESTDGRSGLVLVSGQSVQDDVISQINFTHHDTANASKRGAVLKARRGTTVDSMYFDFSVYNDGTNVDAFRIRQDGDVGINEPNPDSKLEVNGTFHVTGAAQLDSTLNIGTTTASPSSVADDLVVEGTSPGISILTTNDNATTSLFFGSPSDSAGAALQWQHSANERLTIRTSVTDGNILLQSGNQVDAVFIDGSQNVGVGATPVASKFEVTTTGTTHLGIMAGDGFVSGILFGDASDNDIGKFQYEHSAERFEMRVNNAAAMAVGEGRVRISTTSVGIQDYSDLRLDNTGVLELKETTTPTDDSGYGKVYCKSDNKLYFQDGAGTEHEVAFV